MPAVMREKQPYLFLLVIAVSSLQFVDAQMPADSSTQSVVKQFYQAVADNALLYSGTEFKNTDPNIHSDPYWINEILKGDLLYSDVMYHNIPLIYNILNGEVISQKYNNGVFMVLISEKIKAFSIAGHTFIRLTGNQANNASIDEGFYDLLYNGNEQVFARYRKHLNESNNLDKRFVQTTSYFIQKEGKYFAVKRKKELLSVFKDKKSDIRKYMRKNKLDYNIEPVEALTKVAAFYDQLKK